MREALRMAMDDINGANENLAEALMILPTIYSEYCELPRVLKEEEYYETNNYPDVIKIEARHSGVDVDMATLGTMLNIYGEVGYSTKIATRHPGILCKQADDAKYKCAAFLVDKINDARARFVTIAHREKDKNIRFEVVHEMFPMLIMRNMQREIECIRNPEKYYLGWGNKPIVTKLDVDALEGRLIDDMEKEPPLHMSRGEWVSKVKNEILAIKRLSRFEKLRMRRPVKSQAIATIDGYSKVCPIPKLVLMSEPVMPHFKPLSDYDKSKSKPRGKKVEWRPVIDRYHVYATA